MTERKRYTKEFKLDAISLVKDQGYKQSEAAKNLGMKSLVKSPAPSSSVMNFRLPARQSH